MAETPVPPDSTSPEPAAPGAAPGRKLTPEAVRALEEAAARRAARKAAPLPPETGGPKGARQGAEPTRYGDWERNGRAVDF